ncbi:MAG: DUF3857 domain-containing protein, partial [Candidatus Eisenbacteria bacterium]|nr:DUF3857 domain-containing protein [Candidatus Eisenbacteria bacterium]
LAPAHARGAGATEDAVADGWSALWSNDYATAERLFSSALSVDDDDHGARRGLLLAALALGRDDLVLEQLEEYADRAPTSPYDYFVPRVTGQVSEMDSRKYYETLARFAERLAGDGDMAPVDRRMCRGLACRYAYMAGDKGAVRDLAEDLNRIDAWSILGPFDNTSGSGHAARHPGVRFSTEATFSGKFGQSIEWFTPARVALDRSLCPTAYFHQDMNTTAYVRTVAQVDEPGRYLISLGHEGDVRFLINGTLIHEADRLEGGTEVAHWHVELPEGGNLLSFKVSNRDERSVISCAVSRPDGSAAPVSFDATRELRIPPDAAIEPVPVEAGFLTRVAAAARDRPGDPEAQFWNLQRVQSTAPADSVLTLCEKLEERFPESALMRLAVAAAYRAAGDEDRFSAQVARAAELSSQLAPAVLHVAGEDADRKRYAEARAVAQGVLQRASKCRGALGLRMRTLLEEQLLEELRTAAERAVELVPDDPVGHSYLAAHAAARGLSTEEREHRKKMVSRLPIPSAIAARYLESAERDDYEEMEDELRRFMELAPDSALLMERYVGTLLARDRMDRAYDAMAEGLGSFPQSVTLIYYRALFVESGYEFDHSVINDLFPSDKRTLTDEEMAAMWPEGEPPTRHISLYDSDAVQRWLRCHCARLAADVLEDALAIDPGNFRLREKVRALRAKPPFRTFMPDPDEDAIIALRVDPEHYAGEDAVVLTERKRRLAYDDHASIVDYCVAVQMLNEEGIGRWEDYRVSVNPHAADVVYLESKTIKEDGTVFEAETGLARVLFKNVQPGDILYLHYQSTTHVSGALSGNFWDYHLFSFGVPCLQSSYTLIAPADRDVAFELRNAEGAADSVAYEERVMEDGFVGREWRCSEPPEFGEEYGSPPARSYLPWVDVTTIGDWETLARWYAGLADGQTRVTRRIRLEAERLCAGAASDEERIERVLAFVADEITYQSIPFYQSAHIPREADEVLRDRFGDCKDKCALLISLLKAAGLIDCHFALVSVGSHERLTFLPSPRFDHAIVCRLLPDGGERWYDPTVRFPDPEQIPGHIAGAPALVARRGEKALRTIPVQDVCERPYEVETRASLSPAGSVSGVRTSRYALIDETSARRVHLASTSREELADEILASLAVSCPGVELLDLRVAGEDAARETLVYEYDFRAPNAFSVTGGMLSGALPPDSRLTDVFGALVAKRERRSPVDLRALRMCELARTVLEVPDGLEIAALPEPAELTFGECRYSTAYEKTDGRLVIERSTTIEGREVPVADYPGFKTFLDGVLQDMRTPLLFRKRG